MRAVVQRVREASVSVESGENISETVGRIGQGLLVFLGVGQGDDDTDIRYLADKVLDLRIFEDGERKMNRSLRDVSGEILVISQFTLYGDCRKGRRPSFDAAETPTRADELYRRWIDYVRDQGFSPQEGVFGAMMDVRLVNHGPVTLLLDSKKTF